MSKTVRTGLLTGAVALGLAGCGGSGGDDTPVAAPALTVTGTAATGAALAEAQVTVKCATGGGSGKAGADGRFSIPLDSGAVLPCVLEAKLGTTVLHGALGEGTVANVTPLTELALARAAGGTAAALFDSFDAAAQAKLSAANRAAALQSLRTALQGTVALGEGEDPFKTPFAVGDASDQKLDALRHALSQAGTSLAELGSALAASGATPGTAAALLQPASATCKGLRTGSYRVVDPTAGDNDDTLLKIDVATLTITPPGGAAAGQIKDLGGCRFGSADNADTTQLLVAPSGMAAVVRRDTPTSPDYALVIVPNQTLPVSELVGTWNKLEFSMDDGGTLQPVPGSFTLGSDGTLTLTAQCDSTSCAAPPTPETYKLRADAAGGFTIQTDAGPARFFAFKTADGHPTLVGRLPARSGMIFATRQQALALPALDSVSGNWNLQIEGNGAVSSLASVSNTTTAVDAQKQVVSFLRANDQRTDVQAFNSPLPGMRLRKANDCTAGGQPVACAGNFILPLQGTGMSVYGGYRPGNVTFFGASIRQP